MGHSVIDVAFDLDMSTSTGKKRFFRTACEYFAGYPHCAAT